MQHGTPPYLGAVPNLGQPQVMVPRSVMASLVGRIVQRDRVMKDGTTQTAQAMVVAVADQADSDDGTTMRRWSLLVLDEHGTLDVWGVGGAGVTISPVREG